MRRATILTVVILLGAAIALADAQQTGVPVSERSRAAVHMSNTFLSDDTMARLPESARYRPPGRTDPGLELEVG